MSSPSSPDDPQKLTRRAVLVGTAAAATGLIGFSAWQVGRQPPARVITLAASSYEADLVDLLLRGIREFPDTVARARGARVVLKPNLVEFAETRPINTHPRLVAAAAEAFLKLDAASVVVGEGPGHRRDTELLVEWSGLKDALRSVGVRFVDLNADAARLTALVQNHTGLGELPIAGTILGADLVVSVAKMKTHHWAGATLTMKNLFGTVPGAKVGWPKNPLHWGGIPNSIVDLWHAIRPGFGIVDGIVGMEGDGPIYGTAVPMGAIVMGDQLPAVDATAARLMGLEPWKIEYLSMVAREGGTVSAARIAVEGDRLAARPFAVLPKFDYLKMG